MLLRASCRWAPTSKARILSTSRRSFASSITLRSSEEPIESTGPSSGWYSPRSIEARVSISRRRPVGVSVPRGSPPKSEEDAYLEAGAYGYGSSSAASASDAKGAVSQGIEPAFGADRPPRAKRAKASSAAVMSDVPDASTSKQSLTAREGLFDMFSKSPAAFPVVRVSTGRVSVSNLAAFVRSFQLSAAPAYKALDGCSASALWIGGVPADAAPADIVTSALTGRAGGAAAAVERARKAKQSAGAHEAAASVAAADSVEVRAVTVWRDAASLDAVMSGSAAAGASDALRAYKAAMTALAPYFAGPPSIEVFRLAHERSDPMGPPVAAEPPKRVRAKRKQVTAPDAPLVGPEAGLR